MANQIADSWPEEVGLESAGCCGVIVRALGMGALMAVLVAIAVLLMTQPPERWQGTADPSTHPLALLVDSQSPLRVYMATEQGSILTSRDGGAHWTATSNGLPMHTPVSAFALVPGDGNDLLAGTSAGVYRSQDGGQTWRTTGTGLPQHVIVDAVSALPDETLLAGTTNQGVYVWSNGVAVWQPVDGLPRLSDIYAFLPLAQPGHALAALVSGGIYASQDGGKAWVESDRGMVGASDVNVFSFLDIPRTDGTDCVILAGTSRGVFVSHDHGASWGPSGIGIETTRVISLAYDPLAPTDVFAGADTGGYQAHDGGATWQPLGSGLPSEQHVGAVAVVHPASGTRVILASVDQSYRYPGKWPLASQPWRGLAVGVEAILLVAVGVIIIRWVCILRS